MKAMGSRFYAVSRQWKNAHRDDFWCPFATRKVKADFLSGITSSSSFFDLTLPALV